MFLHIELLNSVIKCKSRLILKQITIYQTSDEGLISYALKYTIKSESTVQFLQGLIKDLLGQERKKKGIIRVEIRKAFESTKKKPIKF